MQVDAWMKSTLGEDPCRELKLKAMKEYTFADDMYEQIEKHVKGEGVYLYMYAK